ncbi:MAG: Rieske (2Fe-2S) protein [Hyphomicrobiaceae bacterium]
MAETKTRHVVARTSEIPLGGRKVVTVDGRGVVVFNLQGEFFALSETCPHKGGSLAGGLCTGLVESSGPGEYHYSRPGEMIRCPWHQWEFDIRTGRSYCDPRRMRLMKFDVAVEPGAKLIEGPYVAETFKVAVEDDYVVVEV